MLFTLDVPALESVLWLLSMLDTGSDELLESESEESGSEEPILLLDDSGCSGPVSFSTVSITGPNALTETATFPLAAVPETVWMSSAF